MNRFDNYWLYFLPILFFPTLGVDADTSMGNIEMSDYMMLPFLFLAVLTPKVKEKILARELFQPVIVFCLWATLTILLIPFFYNYMDSTRVVVFSGLKLAKFVLYGYAGFLMCRLLGRKRNLADYHWIVCVIGLILGLGTIVNYFVEAIFAYRIYKAMNLVSVTLATLTIYLAVLFYIGYGSKSWRKFAAICLTLMGAAITFSGGRGGMVALIVMVMVFMVQHRLKFKQMATIFVVISGGFYLYLYNPSFQLEIQRTFFQGDYQSYKEDKDVDDGHRLATWANEAPKLLDAPLMGSGFFHRGGKSRLWSTGSHNFWLQIVLEVGLFGGLLFYFIIQRLFNHSRKISIRHGDFSKAFNYALFGCIIGNLTGEYLYGGIGLLALLVIYAPVGSTLKSELKPS